MLVDLMRKNQRWLMFVVAVLTIISFIWLYSTRASRPDRDGGENAVVARVYNRPITRSDLERVGRQFRTAFELGLPNFTRQEFSGDPNYAWNLLVVRNEADKLGLQPGEEEIAEAIKKIPTFQADGGGGFDPGKYTRFVDNKLGPRGFSARELEELVRADLQIGRVRDLLGATVVVPPDELRADYEQAFAKTAASVIRLKAADLAKDITVSDEDVKKYYDEQKDHLQDPERRRVQFVTFALTEEQNKLPARERTETAQKLSDRADQFSQKMLEPGADFAKVAGSFEVPLKETPEFAKATAGLVLKDSKDVPLDLVSDFAASAFRLTQADPNSDALPGPDSGSFYILHLAGVVPPRPLSLEEAQPKIVESIKNTRARETLTARAAEIRLKLLTQIAAGKPVAEAARAVGQTAQDLAPFDLNDPPFNIQDADLIIERTTQLNAGEMSTLLPTPEGGVFVYLRSREPIDEAKFAQQRPQLLTQQRLARERLTFAEWLRVSRENAGIRGLGAGEES